MTNTDAPNTAIAHPAASLLRDVEHPCARLCMACGRLCDPAPVQPYRADRGHMAPETCPHCGQPELADLASATTALALADALERDRLARSPRAPRLARRLVTIAVPAVLLGCLVLTVLMLAVFGRGKGVQVAPTLALMLLVLFGGPGLLLATRAIAQTWRRTIPRALPARWRLCLPTAGASGRTVTAPAAGVGPLLTAPISGRQCVAFEVGLREDDDADAGPGTWLLLEQRCAPLAVGDLHVARDGANLELAREQIAWPGPGPDRDRAALFLRGRGFVISEAAPLRVFEAVVEVGDVVALHDTRPPTIRVPRGTRP